jgi:hypothetical protein
MKISNKPAAVVLMLTTFFMLPVIPTMAQTSSADQPGGNDQLLSLVEFESKAVTKKDQFETTEAFQKRLSENVGREFLVTVGLGTDPLGLRKTRAFSYNADTQTLTVTLVGDSSIQILKIIDSSSEEGRRLPPQVMLNGRYTKFTLVKTGPELEKEYPGQNAMGATTTIRVYKSTFSAVALLNVPENSNPPLATMEVKMAPDAARALSTRAQWSLLLKTAMAPGQKSLALDDGDYHQPTIDNPVEAYTAGRTITASLIRAQLIDPESNAVIAAFGPKGEQPASIPTSAKDHAVLGVLLAPITPAIATALALAGTDGAMVTTVAPASAADKAGIKQGDILLKIAGKDIKGPLDVAAALATVPPGSSASVTLIHQGMHADVTVSF